MLYGYVLVIQ